MEFSALHIEGAFIVELKKISDERGFFARTFCTTEFSAIGPTCSMVQANTSYNKKRGTLRGLHMQNAPFQEAKLVRCTRGSIFDVLVDLRKHSPTYKQWFGIELTSQNHKMLFIPEGCAHGYLTLEDDTEVFYQVSQLYTPGAELIFRWDDPAFGIDWPIQPEVVSEKDKNAPFFGQPATLLGVS